MSQRRARQSLFSRGVLSPTAPGMPPKVQYSFQSTSGGSCLTAQNSLKESGKTLTSSQRPLRRVLMPPERKRESDPVI